MGGSLVIRIPYWFILMVLLIVSYPFNWYMMKEGVGCYNNDPNCQWEDSNRNKHTGPSQGNRFASLLFSPITAPVNGIWWLSNVSAEQEKK